MTSFIDAMLAAGLPAQNIPVDGKMHRFGEKKVCWAVNHGDHGAFGDWSKDINEKWTETGSNIDPARWRKTKAQAARAKKEGDLERQKEMEQVAIKAENLWKELSETGQSEYLKQKRVDAFGIRFEPDSKITVPMLDADNKLWSLQHISPDGSKRFLTGGRKKGCFHIIGQFDHAGTIYISEGYATGASVHMATGRPVIIAFDAGNILPVVDSIKKKYPDLKIIITADNDCWKPESGNPGKEKAEEAARKFGCTAIFPKFKDTSTAPTDYNDLHCLEGLAAVKAQLTEAANKQPEAATGDFISCRFKVDGKGVFYCGLDREGKKLPPRWICSALRITAKTRDAKSGEWGRLLEWKDDDGVAHRWAMPLELLQGDGSDVRRELARAGLSIAPGKSARDRLTEYLQVWPVEDRARCVERLGWHGGVYVTPDETIGKNGEIVVFQNAHALEPALSVSGTVEEWRENVASLAAGNSRLMFAISASFAAALVDVAGEDSGGFHLRGGSTIGKTKALDAAASVWGNPRAYSRLWRTTANGLEGLAALHNDGLLILDEMNQVDPKEAGEASYLLANEQGKVRASRSGMARQSARWRLLFLSAGEESLAALMARVGKRATAGQEIRLADIPADAGADMGIFEILNGQPTPAALALAVKDAASKYNGAAGMQWLRCIVANRATLPDFLSDGIKKFVNEVVPKDATAQVGRVARRFAIVAVAGELATHYGLTGWQEGEAIKAARKCFNAWLESFGGTGNREERVILSQVKAFFEAHGASRFQDTKAENDPRIINRAGFYRDGTDGKREFIVLPEIYQKEVCAGYDAKTVTQALLKKGWIVPGGDGRTQQKPRLPGLGTTWCYVFAGKMWESEE